MAKTKRILVDFAATTLKSAITAGAVSLELSSTTNFPTTLAADEFYVGTLTQPGVETSWEYVRVDSIAGSVLTIVRAFQGTTAQDWPVGSRFELRGTSKDFLKPGAAEPLGPALTPQVGTSEFGSREDHQHARPNWADVQGQPGAFGPSGAAHGAGFVPDPGADAGSSRYLCEDGGWSKPPTFDPISAFHRFS